MQMQRENAKQYIILREFYLQQMRIFVTQNRMDLAFFGYATSQNHTKIYQKCIRRRVRAVLTQQIFSSPKAFLAGHIGDMSKRKAAGIGQICMSKPTWLDSRSARHCCHIGLVLLYHISSVFSIAKCHFSEILQPHISFLLL